MEGGEKRSVEDLLQTVQPWIDRMPALGKRIIRGAGLDATVILAALTAVENAEEKYTKQIAILVYWARCLRREISPVGESDRG